MIHRHVLLDDRGGIEIGNNVSISDYANIYSHTHDIDQIAMVYNRTTASEMVLASRITRPFWPAFKSVIAQCWEVERLPQTTSKPYHIRVGVPAKTVKVKTRVGNDAAGD